MGAVNTPDPAPLDLERGRENGALRAIGWIEKLFLAIGAAAILSMCAYITLGIFLRSVVGVQIPDEVVIVGDLMIAALILPLAYVAADRGFIAVEVLSDQLPRSLHPALNVLAAAVGLLAVMPIGYGAFLAMIHAIESGNYFFGILELPEWPGRTAFFAGYALFFIRLIVLFVQDFMTATGLGGGRADGDGPGKTHEPSWEEPA